MHPKLRAFIHTMINPVPPPECRAEAPAASSAAQPTTCPTCSTCRFWRQWGRAQQTIPGAMNGSCHRRAPQLFLIESQTRTKWPATYATDGCGDHRPTPRGD